MAWERSRVFVTEKTGKNSHHFRLSDFRMRTHIAIWASLSILSAIFLLSASWKLFRFIRWIAAASLYAQLAISLKSGKDEICLVFGGRWIAGVRVRRALLVMIGVRPRAFSFIPILLSISFFCSNSLSAQSTACMKRAFSTSTSFLRMNSLSAFSIASMNWVSSVSVSIGFCLIVRAALTLSWSRSEREIRQKIIYYDNWFPLLRHDSL